MTEAEKMLEALGFKFDSACDYGATAICLYKKDSNTVNFTLLKNRGEWKADVFNEHSYSYAFDVKLARAIVKRLEELNGAL